MNEVWHKDVKVKAKSLGDAYKKGYFTGSMTRWELMDRLTKHNPQLRWYANETHRGLFDPKNGFICGIGHNLTIPKFTIMREEDGYVWTRSWKIIFRLVAKRGYEIDTTGLI